MAAVSSHGNQSHVVILNDNEEAAYFLNDLENILGEGHAFFFPASYKKSFHVDEADNSNILMRAEVLSKLNRNSKTLVITYPEAIAEKVVTRRNLELNSIAMRVKDSISISFINEFLLHHEFENVDFVQQAGEFSIRGGIVDIYSFANELPYRIEFFGDEVESIRTFDPETQLSVQAMNHIAIMPNVQKKLLEEGRSSFLDFIASDSVIWTYELSSSLEFLKLNLLSEYDNNVKPELNDLFDSPDILLEKLQNKKVVEFGKRHFLKSDFEKSFSFSPQPSFNKNFPLLISNLQQNQKQKIKNIIFADTAKQIERLYAIFEDLEKKNTIENKVEFTSLLLSLHEGFIDNEGKLACYTDHQIFDRYHRFRLKKKHNRNESLTLKELSSLKPGDYVTHIDHGVGRFAGLEAIIVNGKPQEAVRLIYKDNDILYVSIHSLHRIAKYTGKEGFQLFINLDPLHGQR